MRCARLRARVALHFSGALYTIFRASAPPGHPLLGCVRPVSPTKAGSIRGRPPAVIPPRTAEARHRHGCVPSWRKRRTASAQCRARAHAQVHVRSHEPPLAPMRQCDRSSKSRNATNVAGARPQTHFKSALKPHRSAPIVVAGSARLCRMLHRCDSGRRSDLAWKPKNQNFIATGRRPFTRSRPRGNRLRQSDLRERTPLRRLRSSSSAHPARTTHSPRQPRAPHRCDSCDPRFSLAPLTPRKCCRDVATPLRIHRCAPLPNHVANATDTRKTRDAPRRGLARGLYYEPAHGGDERQPHDHHRRHADG